jgi:hypothetical protein
MRRLFLAAAMTLFLSGSSRADVVTFSTGQSGADTNIQQGTSFIIDFGVVSGTTVTEIQTNFTMKIDGGSNNAPNATIQMSLYDAPDGGGTLLATSPSKSASDFTQQFTSGYNFDIPSISLVGPHNYSLVLWSNDTANGKYHIKTSVSSSDPNVPLGQVPGVPEPATYLSASLVAGLMGLGYIWRRRQLNVG